MDKSVGDARWKLVEAEREAARKAVVFQCLGSNRVPDDKPNFVESENEVVERIRHLVVNSIPKSMM